MGTLSEYLEKFRCLRRGVTDYGPAPHKLILLLAVIKEASEGRLRQNRIEPTEHLHLLFLSLWDAHVQTAHVPNLALPFFHLHNEGFWHLQATPGKKSWLERQNTIGSLGTLRAGVQHATLDPELHALLGNRTARESLQQALLLELKRFENPPPDQPCPFCLVGKDHETIVENELAVAFYDRFPVSPGHTLIIPRRHVACYFSLDQDELRCIHELTFACRRILLENHHPDGFNVGVNAGLAAGQTIFHCHLHLIPRYHGDVADPRGGVRGVIPEKQFY